MKFVGVHRAFLRGEPAVRAPAAALGHWLRVVSYASEVENGGLIRGAAAFDDRTWLVLTMVTRVEVDEIVTAGLAAWEGTDLRVLGYDIDGEAKVKACRTNGAKSLGRPRQADQKTQAKPVAKPRRNHLVIPGETHGQTQGESQTKPLSLPYRLGAPPNDEDLEGLGRALASGAEP